MVSITSRKFRTRGLDVDFDFVRGGAARIELAEPERAGRTTDSEFSAPLELTLLRKILPSGNLGRIDAPQPADEAARTAEGDLLVDVMLGHLPHESVELLGAGRGGKIDKP